MLMISVKNIDEKHNVTFFDKDYEIPDILTDARHHTYFGNTIWTINNFLTHEESQFQLLIFLQVLSITIEKSQQLVRFYNHPA